MSRHSVRVATTKVDYGEFSLGNFEPSDSKAIRPQKVKANNTGGHEFEKGKRNAMYIEARRHANAIVNQGLSCLEEAKATLAVIRQQEVGLERQLSLYQAALEGQENAYEALIAMYPPMLEDLGHRRVERMDLASQMHQNNPARRAAEMRRVSRETRKKLEVSKQEAKEATDATLLIKSMKAMMGNF